jgi:hypothetical protein
MHSTVKRWFAISAAAVLVGFAAAPASADDPVGAGAESRINSMFCVSDYRFSATESTQVAVCGGKYVNANGDTSDAGASSYRLRNRVLALVENCAPGDQPNGLWVCDSSAYEDYVTDSELSIAAFLGKASVHATVGGCRIDVDAVSTSLYEEHGRAPGLGHAASPNGAGFSVDADEEVSRQATGSGSVCGAALYPRFGTIGDYVNPRVDVWANTTPA